MPKISLWKIELGVFSVLLCFLVIKFFLITQITSSPDELLRSYKFVYTDSFDWFANGLRLFDNASITLRNPGLPLMIKLLSGAGLIYLLPLLNQLAFLGLVISIYYSLKALTKHVPISMGIALLVFANFTWATFANYLMADIYAITAFSWAIYGMLSKRYKTSFALLGVSMLFQNFGYFLYPFWVIWYILLRRQEIKRCINKNPFKHIKVYVGLFLPVLLPLLIILPWHMYKWIYFGSPLYTKIDQMALLKFHTSSISYYSHVAVNSLGLLLLAVVACGLYVVIRRRSELRNEGLAFVMLGLVLSGVFWVLCYDWPDKRFLLYVTPWFYLLVGYMFFVVLGKVRPVLLLCVFVVLLYHASLPSAPKATMKQLPLADDYYILFKDFGGLFQAKVARNRDYRNPVMNLSPILYDSYKKSGYYRDSQADKYNAAIDYVDANYDISRHCFSVLTGETYTINSVLVIRYNTDIDKHTKICT